MKLEDFRYSWKTLPVSTKNRHEIEQMFSPKNLPALQRIRLKLIVEFVLLTVFLLVYYDWFDGHKKPLYANILLVTSLLMFLGQEVRMYLSLLRPVRENSIRLSLEKFSRRLQQHALVYILLSVFFDVAFLVYFTAGVSFTSEKYLILAGAIFSGGIFFFFSCSQWLKRIRHIRKILDSFSEN